MQQGHSLTHLIDALIAKYIAHRYREQDVITFQGKTVEEIEKRFGDSVDDYLGFCAQRGEKPDKPFTGRRMLRLPPELHRRAYLGAQREGKSLNQWISDKLLELA
ncbi:MAG: toxin-antitoxin system HicB family antitoxin [Salinisphaeraceae bacterium]|nr:toxin-antitoxin system HicB family antitoxin [Salinisphaeraceae bacterium]